MGVGRNDQCPCGSGKKYKKCCLSQDQAAASAANETRELEPARELPERTSPEWKPSLVPVSRQPELPQHPPDPVMDALNQRWREYERLNDDGNCRDLFLKTLDEPELMDDEMSFGMLGDLRNRAVAADNLEAWEELVDHLRRRLPDVYAVNRKYYLHWNLEDALASHRLERVPALAREMAETAGDDVDIFGLVIDLLAYHGQLGAMSDALHIAWPLIRESSNILWGQDDFARWGADCVLYERLEQTPDLDGRDPELIAAMRFFIAELNPEYLAEYVDCLCGRMQRTWSLEDFEKSARRRKVRVRKPPAEGEPSDAEPVLDLGRDALTYLGEEFIRQARRQKGISFVKAALARDNILRYIRERNAGELKKKPSMLDSMFGEPKKATKKVRYDHPLCPDRDTLDRYFAQRFSGFLPQMHTVAATFDLFPTWLNFLENQGLLEPTQRQTALDEIAPLQPTLLELWQVDSSARALAQNLKRWPEIADDTTA